MNKKKRLTLIFILVLILGVGSYFYYNNLYIYNFIDREKILDNDFEINDVTSNSVKFTEKGLGHSYILKTFTLERIKNNTEFESNVKSIETFYPSLGYKEFYKDESTLVYLKKEDSEHFNCFINKYLEDKKIYIKITYVSDEIIMPYEINFLIDEAESFLKY